MAGNDTNPGNITDPDWNHVAGVGGTAGPGGNGLVVIYYGAVQVASLFPEKGTSLGGTTLTIQGVGFASGTAVNLGNRGCSNVQITSHSQLTCVTPPVNSPGAVDVALQVPGAQDFTIKGGFTYN